mgnify:CR=1 FL=1
MRASRPAGTALAGILLVAAAACGKKGSLRPPEPRGPLAPRDVAARQEGPRVAVSFTMPDPRGPKESQAPVEAELVRLARPPGSSAPAEAEAFRRAPVVAVIGGDPLPGGARLRVEDSSWTALQGGGVGWTLRYAVRVRDRHRRPSPLVVAHDLVPVAPLPPPTGLAAEATAEGVRLVWNPPSDGPFLFNLYRSPAGEPFGERPLNEDPVPSTEYLDAVVEVGRTYRYVVRTSAAGGAPYRESGSAGPIEVVAEDRFPPSAPTGLVAVQEGSAIRLFWNPNQERDLAGYRVERRLGTEGGWRPLGAGATAEPFYLDDEAAAGARAAYRVVAVDGAGNAGPPSEPSEILVAEDPDDGGAP